MELSIQAGAYASPELGEAEVVERKGTGHPDTICDALAEEVSRALCLHYLRRFGVILHHNVDKVLLCAGTARPGFGGGEVLDPIEVYLAGRAAAEHNGERVPAGDLAVEACRSWLRSHLPALDLERHVRIIPKFHPGSGALTGLFSNRGAHAPLSNDTSAGAGFAPFTRLERVVLEVERTLNSPETKQAHPAIGQDVKVMGVRHGSRIRLTIGCAMIGRYLAGLPDYLEAKAAARELALAAAQRITDLRADAVVNAADDVEKGNLYLTVTGTSAEAGDDGEAGRGNRASGLITPYRPMTLEAAAGKNPVTHVGKLYNLAAARIAGRLVRAVGGVRGASCVLVSEIGRPIDDPQLADVRLELESGRAEGEALRASVRENVLGELRRFDELQAGLLASQVGVY